MIKNNIVIQNNQHLGDIKVKVNYYFILSTNQNCDVCSDFAKLEHTQKERVIKFIKRKIKGV